MKVVNRLKVLGVLNGLEVVETGSEGYILVENTPEVHEKLNALGVSSETIDGYGEEGTLCIIALAFSEGYANDYIDGKLVYISPLKFANEGGKIDENGWVLDYSFLMGVHAKMSNLTYGAREVGLDTIEAVLLVANGDEELLKQRVIPSEGTYLS